MCGRFASLGCLVGLSLALVAPVGAGTIGLSWSPSAGASGYRVYYASTPGEYLQTPIYDGPSTSAVISDDDIQGCQTGHFSVTAYNPAGESGYSAPVSSWPRPEIQSASPAQAMQGSSFTLSVAGQSFDAGSLLSVDNPGIVLENAFTSCDGACNCEYEVVATIEPMGKGVQPAMIGASTIVLINQDGLSDSSQTLEVDINPARFDVNTSVPESDGRLDGLDAAWMSVIFGTQSGDGSYDPDFDFDGDGWVDGVDLAYLGSNFGECWDGATWKASACE